MTRLKLDSFTDESGQDTKGRFFVVCSVILASSDVPEIGARLEAVEKDSGKLKKWYHTGNKYRHKYVRLLLERKLFNGLEIYYSTYQNKKDYIRLIGSHLAKAILAYSRGRENITKVFIDKVDKGTLFRLKEEIKSFHIRYKKIRGLPEESSPFIRLADAVCGLVRDLGNRGVANSYKVIFGRMKEV